MYVALSCFFSDTNQGSHQPPNSTSVPVNFSNQVSTSSSIAKPVGTIMKAKAKKRKSVVDFSVLAQRDIEGLMQKKQAAQVLQPAQSMFLFHFLKEN